ATGSPDTRPRTRKPSGSSHSRLASAVITQSLGGAIVAVSQVAKDPEQAAVGVREYLAPQIPVYNVSKRRAIWLTTSYTIQRWLIVDKGTTLASVLSLQTLFSVVPLIGMLLTGVGLLGEDRGNQLVLQIATLLFPTAERAEEMSGLVTMVASNITLERLGLSGFIAALVVATLLFTTLEQTANQIWGVTRKRSPVAKFTMFYTLLTLAPLILFYSLAQPVVSRVAEQSFIPTPYLTSGLGFVLLNKFMPATSVRWGPALVGGLFSSVIFEAGKQAFAYYLSAIATYESVYGSLSILPVFIFWTYLIWLLVLLGMELSFVIQHLDIVKSEGYVNPSMRKDLRGRVVSDARIAAHLVLAICDNYERRHAGLSVPELEERFKLGLSRVVSITDRLTEAGLLLETSAEYTSFVPARPTDQITAREVIDLFEHGDLPSARRDDPLRDLFAEIDVQKADVIGELTFRELIERVRAESSMMPKPFGLVDDDGVYSGELHRAEPPPPRTSVATVAGALNRAPESSVEDASAKPSAGFRGPRHETFIGR
ncbi:MAG: YihY/virulence factor BrkB family protein, partial [Myxococcales bacterium]|nr:YihY/virulence factor BrkB family protein [Myxococcales bacterium]